VFARAEPVVNAKFEKIIDVPRRSPVTATPADPGDPPVPEDQEPAPSSLVAHIQGAMEHQKALLARELHDELGGLLVGAVMDLAWAEQHLSAPTAELKQKLVRARQTLAAAIDLKRKLIEELRPTLLDNVGLFAALRWHVQAACNRAGLTCTILVPDEERRFLPNIPITIFRIVQEALAVIVARKPVVSAEFSVTTDGRTLSINVRGNGSAELTHAPAGAGEHFLAAIEQRATSLGGEFMSAYLPTGGTSITVRLPFDGTVIA
jgi:hypothetical protein